MANNNKTEQFIVMLPKDLKKKYFKLCKDEFTNASEDVRRFIINRVKESTS